MPSSSSISLSHLRKLRSDLAKHSREKISGVIGNSMKNEEADPCREMTNRNLWPKTDLFARNEVKYRRAPIEFQEKLIQVGNAAVSPEPIFCQKTIDFMPISPDFRQDSHSFTFFAIDANSMIAISCQTSLNPTLTNPIRCRQLNERDSWTSNKLNKSLI
jgi:hypothetical protein